MGEKTQKKVVVRQKAAPGPGKGEKFYRQMLENIAQGIADSVYLISRDYKILWANAAASKLTGRKINELVGMHCYEATHNRRRPCTPPDDICPMDEALKTGKSVSVIHRHYDKKGRMRFVEVNLHPVKNENGEISQFVHISRDVTARQQMHDELLKFKLGLERSDAAVFITDIDGTINYVNPAFEKLYGFKKEEALGKTPRIIKSGRVPKSAYTQFWDTLLAKKVFSGEILNKAKDGRLLAVEGSTNPILDKSGNIMGFLAIQRDITGRKKAEGDLEKLNQELQSKIRELERFNRLTVGRELKMIELKKRINELEKEGAK